MKLGFYGGAGEVTGSRYRVEAGEARLLLDCGLFQGHRSESIRKSREFPFKPGDLSAVLLSHAHIDHSGCLPLLCKSGFSGPIHCTQATKDLCGVMLMDSAHLQEEDAKFFNKIHQKDGQRIEPLYTERDALAALERFVPHEFGEPFQAGPGVRAWLMNAGHVLGSAMIQLEAETPKGSRRLLYTGDLGRSKALLLEHPDYRGTAHYVLTESTYGGRVHEPVARIEDQLKAVVLRAAAEKGKVLIPSFALERAQEILFILEKLRREHIIPPIPVYVDSPLAVRITEIFDRNLKSPSFDDVFKAYAAKEGDPFGFETIHYVRSVEESKALNDLPGPRIILAGSGMCEGGRILHHLRNNIEKDTTTVLLVGYQAEGTLGRRISEGAKKVRIFGLEHEVGAQVETLHMLSSHADQEDILKFLKELDPPPLTTFLVHGEPRERQALAERLKSSGFDHIVCPEFGDTVELD